MLVISVSIFLGYVWPSISDARTANALYLQKQAELGQLEEKQQKIDDINNKITNDSVSIQLLSGYLPKTRTEEQVLNNINFIATSAGVSLANIALTNVPPVVKQQQDDAPVLDGGQPLIADPTMPVVALDAETLLGFTSAKISASGSYENLQMFVDKLQHSGTHGKLKSFSIEKNKAEGGQGLLVADLVIDFGYLSPIKFDNQMLATFVPTFDSAAVEPLKNFVSQKNQAIDIGNTGKTNPFQQ
jgi:hypothetical protein